MQDPDLLVHEFLGCVNLLFIWNVPTDLEVVNVAGFAPVLLGEVRMKLFLTV